MAVRVSVIICTHDRPEGLARAVGSVMAQSYQAAEIIIVNDGSVDVPDGIGAGASPPPVRIRSARASLPASRNLGIDAASGDVLLLLDDDVVLPGGYLAALAEMYDADQAGQVAAIGGIMVRAEPLKPAQRLWRAVAAALASNRWGGRKCAARYVKLPLSLRRRLAPARVLSGGAIRVRRSAARVCRFEDAFDGYALGEDLDFALRLTRVRGVFIAGELQVRHETGAGGRPDMAARGRMYVANMIHIARNSTEADVGTWTLLTYHFLGMMVLGLVWSALSGRRANLDLAMGMAGELCRRAGGSMRKLLCGC
ncbi:MAG: glycosyltransferase [Pseudomonadota bacterium]